VRRSWWVLAGIAALAAAASVAAQPLNGAAQKLIAEQQLGSARVGAYAIDLRTGEELLSIEPDEQFIPASNMKLLTSAAALAVLGPDFSFRTEVWRSGDDVLIVGDGDPALADPELLEEMGVSVREFLDLWASEIAARAGGAGEGGGELLIDDRLFDQERAHPSWPRDQLNRWYCAEVSALNFHANVLCLHLSPGPGGGPPRVVTEPEAAWLAPRNLGKTTSRGRNTAWVSRAPRSNDMELRGAIRRATSEPLEVAIHDPAMVFGRLLSAKLAEKEGFERPVRRVGPGETPPRDGLILAVETDLPRVLERCNVDSHNLYAEALFKRLAAAVTGNVGDWATGVAVMRMVLQEYLSDAREVGVATDVEIADGSGMSRENRVTPRLMARWLEAAGEREHAGVFLESLPVAGREGTLRRRFRASDPERVVRAKSGYLSGVSCLSGYVLGADGTPAATFAVLVEDIPKNVPVSRAKALHERVVLEIEDWLDERLRTADAPTP